MATIRARQKAIADIDPRLLCCDGLRQRLALVEGAEFDLEPGGIKRTMTCPNCGHVTPVVTVMRVEGGPLQGPYGVFGAVTVEFFDLDEGVQ